MESSTSWSSGGGRTDPRAVLREWWGHAAGLVAIWTRISLPGAVVAGWLGAGTSFADWVVPTMAGPLSAGIYALVYQVLRAFPPLPLELLKPVDTLLLGMASMGGAMVLKVAAGSPAPLWIPGALLWVLAWFLNWGPDRVRLRTTQPWLTERLPVTPSFVAPAAGPVTAGFRSYDATHAGLDIGLVRGSPVSAPARGLVRRAGPYDQWGYAVLLDHGDGWTTLLAHLERPLVRPGQQVGAGQLVGLSGASGISTGPHLHLEVRYWGVPVDPVALLRDTELQAPRK